MKRVINTEINTINIHDLNDNNLIGIENKEDGKDRSYMVKIENQQYIALSIPSIESLAVFGSIKEYCDYFQDNYNIYAFKDVEELKKWLLQ